MPVFQKKANVELKTPLVIIYEQNKMFLPSTTTFSSWKVHFPDAVNLSLRAG